MTGVPRVYEKIHNALQDGIARLPQPRRALARWGVAVGYRAGARVAGRAAGVRLAAGAARRRGPPRPLEDARPHRRPHALPRVRQRPALGEDRRVLLRDRPPGDRRLRAHGELAVHHRQPARRAAAWHRRQGRSRRRRAPRARTARCSRAGRTSCRATTTAPTRRPRRSRTAGCTPATSGRSTPTAT